jgi:hypothetical protein
MSMRYSNACIEFCKVDLSCLPKLAKAYNINSEATSQQLPSLVLFENGKEIARFPSVTAQGRPTVAVAYHEIHIARCLGLDKRFYMTSAQ